MDILLAEDSVCVRWILKEYLKDLGYTRVDVVSNGREAIRLAGTKRYDLILLDVSLPMVSGIDVAKHIRNTSLPCVNIIGIPHNAIESRTECLKAGYDAVYNKPTSINELEAIVGRWAKIRRGIIN